MSSANGHVPDIFQNGVVSAIEIAMPKMSKGQKAIARFILSDYDRAAYMTAAKIGDEVGVSESTVVRFAMELDCDGYPHFQKLLQEELKVKLTSVQRLHASSRYGDDAEIIKSILMTDMDNVKKTYERMDKEAFAHAIEAILSARHIFLMGLRSSAPLSSFLHFYFTLLFDGVHHIHSNSANEVFEQILPIGPEDVLLAISFPRYSNQTIQSMQYARKKGATVVGITDKPGTQFAKNLDIGLYAASDMASFVDSLVAPLSLINALIVTLGTRKRDRIVHTFEALEELWEEYQVYHKGPDRLSERAFQEDK